MEEIYKVKIEGTKPLLMHAPVGIGDKPTMRRGEHLEPQKEAEGYLYKDNNGNIGIPSYLIKACIRNAGRNYKIKGRGSTFSSIIRAGIDIEPDFIPINSSWVVDSRPVVVKRSMIIRNRPRFDSWSLEFKIINKDPTIIHMETLKRILEDAGKFYGIGDFRPEYGLFKVISFEKI